MPSFTYPGFSHPVRETIGQIHRATWERIASAGAWWSGDARVAFAAEVRAARERRADPPWLRADAPHSDGPLPAAASEVARRVAIDAHRLDRAWAERMIAALGDAAYVELVSIAVCVTAVDAFAEALGVACEPLPAPKPGAPDRIRPGGMGDGGAWVPMTEPWVGPNVARALSLVPEDHRAFMSLVAAMYSFGDFTELVWDRALTRPQIELVAARVSAVNECFY